MYVLTLLTVLLLTLADDTTKMKVMFFGDSVVSGVHNSKTEICPFRYDFQRGLRGKEVQVVGTNTDIEGACQKVGEELSLQNNGYQNAMIDELLDYITADLQYLYNPVDYIFSSIGLQDCLTWDEGVDFQILSQSIRRIMGRLLNLNENAKIYHIPILLPPSAGKVAIDCMDFVNQKLRDVYDPEKNHGRIRIVDPLVGKTLTDDMFFKIGGETPKPVVAPVAPKPVVAPVAPAVTPPAVATPAVTQPAVTTPMAPVPAVIPAFLAPVAPMPVVAPAAPAVTPPAIATPLVTQPAVITPMAPVPAVAAPVVIAPVAPQIVATPTVPAAPVVPHTVEPSYPTAYDGEGEPRRRLKQPLEYLPNQMLTGMIAEVLIKSMDWEFRAQTPTPTMEVTKEPEYYGYDWCMGKYEEDDCFEYYYGYVWCLEKYSEDECYSYYYGDVDTWEEDDSYKWCLNFYDEEYCSFAYRGEEPDTWDWLSFGYHDCMKGEIDGNECFEQYYGYAWCVNEYADSECYEYYYGDDEWVWDTDTSYKWCLNFYDEAECGIRYNGVSSSASSSASEIGVSTTQLGVGAIIVAGVLFWFCYKKMNCFKSKEYSRLDTRIGGDDEIGLL